MRYQAYNLNIESALLLPELYSGDETIVPDVHVKFGKVPGDGLLNGTQLGPFLWANKASLWLKVPNVATFVVTDGKTILIDPAPGIDDDSVRVFLLGSALGALLFQRGHLVLHGNAIRIGDQCMICVGHSGAGKSTLAAGFMQRGYDVLADDVVPVNDACEAIPGFPRIKLWQDVADHLKIDTTPLRRIRPEMEKFHLPLVHDCSKQPLPVRWVYILNSNESQQAIDIESIQGMQRFLPLRNNTYRVRYLEGMAMKQSHLQLCGKLAGKIHLGRVTRPRKDFQLNQLIDRLLDDMTENP